MKTRRQVHHKKTRILTSGAVPITGLSERVTYFSHGNVDLNDLKVSATCRLDDIHFDEFPEFVLYT